MVEQKGFKTGGQPLVVVGVVVAIVESVDVAAAVVQDAVRDNKRT